MALKKSCSPEDVKNCIERYSFDPTGTNIFSTISRAFVECYQSKVEDYIPTFTRIVSSKLKDAYSCDKLRNLFQRISERLDEISRSLSRRGFVYEFRLTLASRLIVHSRGGRLPFEITLAWDPILNLPYIPSTSIKGVVRAHFEESNIFVDKCDMGELFGYKEHRGLVEFIDAYPIGCRDSLLEPEVITPHYSEAGGSVDEASSAPVPIVFATIAPGATFKLILLIEKDDPTIADKLSKEIAKILSKGVGAKTTLGYGRSIIRITRGC